MACRVEDNPYNISDITIAYERYGKTTLYTHSVGTQPVFKGAHCTSMTVSHNDR